MKKIFFGMCLLAVQYSDCALFLPKFLRPTNKTEMWQLYRNVSCCVAIGSFALSKFFSEVQPNTSTAETIVGSTEPDFQKQYGEQKIKKAKQTDHQLAHNFKAFAILTAASAGFCWYKAAHSESLYQKKLLQKLYAQVNRTQ